MATISNIFIDQDADFTTTVTINDANDVALDLTNYTAAATLRKSYKSTSSTSFTVAFVSPRTTGQITLTLTDTQTGALKQGRYVYDVVITDSTGDKTRVVEGIATIKPSVTR
tara:strand:+ start:14021 stop:14356 length:336 start_codon:yes stop_codon:yes gene_type:complete